MMTSRLTSRALLALLVLAPNMAAAQAAGAVIHVQPAVVTVRTQGATTAILTYSGLAGYTPAEALWCAQLAPATDRGARCDPSAVYGQAPAGARVVSSTGVFTDVMSVPASVAQRAYEAALTGQAGRFYYVRRFVAAAGATGYGPDQYAVVSCQLGGGGASAPFTLTNVRLLADPESPVVFVKRGDHSPSISARIAYTGTGRLRGRWEVVMPGEQAPSREDLMTEGSLPRAARGLQRRYRELERFNVLLLPTGQFTLPGPDPALLPTASDGSYLILLRVEASDDALNETRTAGAADTAGVLHRGASAAFPMPTLRYVVGATGMRAASTLIPQNVRLLLPAPNASVARDSALSLSWTNDRTVGRYRVEVENLANGATLLSAIVAPSVGHYDVPPFVLAQVPAGRVRWRVVALDASGGELGRSEWRRVQPRAQP